MSGVSRVVDVDGIPVSALLQEARRPRAVVLALHGGAAHSGYVDYPGRPHLSLLRTGTALGFTVLVFRGFAEPIAAPLETLGEHVWAWRFGPAAPADIASLFTASPLVVVDEQADGGHNLSIGLTAMAYHLKILSFVEKCVPARASAAQERPGRAS